ncbi:hypothetical protein OIU78_021621 [Salix suchowensis]|nr:hypothetical protein OIU78_021621 [Salix suchowensis]
MWDLLFKMQLCSSRNSR